MGASRRSGLDITDPHSVRSLVDSLRPAAVVNAAASMGNAGGNGADSWSVNVRGAANVAAAAAAVGARLIHVSSDALHAGRPEPYTEADDPTPVFPYGAAKAAAEAAVQAAHPEALLVRTSLLVSGGAPGQPLSRHEETALGLARGTASGALFVDEIRCPVPVCGLAEAILMLIDTDLTGVLNVAGTRAMSRHDLGVLVARANGLDPADVPAGNLSETGLTRPAEVRLDCSVFLGHLPALAPNLTL